MKRTIIIGDIHGCIDTGICHGGYLTADTIPDFKIYSVKAAKNYWSKIKHEWKGIEL
ncbi:MAG: hypothetical protein JW881_08540 [Spirochaetales bacterium]|nr:hypothetical protein [Spirochaetales bacterium]